MKTYITPSQLAETLHVSLRNVRSKIQQREIPSYRFGRRILLCADEIDEVLSRNRVRALSEPKRPAGRISAAPILGD